jgi:periplasmic protein CpxP/Spy
MSSFLTHRIVRSAPIVRSTAIAALLSATMLAGLPIAARTACAAGAEVPQGQAVAPPDSTGAAAAETKGETVEHRITSLHAALKITPEQEKQWNAVAQAMRENASAMDKLVASKRTTPPQNMTAVDDLKTYQQFAQAHVEGLKNLIASFGTLYDAMPADQKKIADGVFNTAGHEPAPSHG